MIRSDLRLNLLLRMELKVTVELLNVESSSGYYPVTSIAGAALLELLWRICS